MALAFDGDVSTAFRAATPVKAGDFVSFVPAKGVTPRQAIVVGTARGEIQVRSGQTWTTIGTISDGAPFHAFAVPAGTNVEEVRLMLAAGSPAPVIREMTVVDRSSNRSRRRLLRSRLHRRLDRARVTITGVRGIPRPRRPRRTGHIRRCRVRESDGFRRT